MCEEKVNFDSLNMKARESFYRYPIERQKQIFEYLSGLDELQRQAYEVAYDHLGLSFSIERSNGLKNWIQNQEKKRKEEEEKSKQQT